MSIGNKRILRTLAAFIAACTMIIHMGCCHYCYQHQPVCPPVASSAPVVRYGAVCDAPSEGTVISQAPSRSSSINDAPRPKVVVSEPSGRNSSGWRRSDPESMATTRVEGASDGEIRSR